MLRAIDGLGSSTSFTKSYYQPFPAGATSIDYNGNVTDLNMLFNYTFWYTGQDWGATNMAMYDAFGAGDWICASPNWYTGGSIARKDVWPMYQAWLAKNGYPTAQMPTGPTGTPQTMTPFACYTTPSNPKGTYIDYDGTQYQCGTGPIMGLPSTFGRYPPWEIKDRTQRGIPIPTCAAVQAYTAATPQVAPSTSILQSWANPVVTSPSQPASSSVSPVGSTVPTLTTQQSGATASPMPSITATAQALSPQPTTPAASDFINTIEANPLLVLGGLAAAALLLFGL